MRASVIYIYGEKWKLRIMKIDRHKIIYCCIYIYVSASRNNSHLCDYFKCIVLASRRLGKRKHYTKYNINALKALQMSKLILSFVSASMFYCLFWCYVAFVFSAQFVFWCHGPHNTLCTIYFRVCVGVHIMMASLCLSTPF